MRKAFIPLLIACVASPAIAQPISDQPFAYAAARGSDRIPAPKDIPYPGVMQLKVDASDTRRAVFQIEQTIPVVQAGRMTLLFPEWLPGTHAPRGQIEKVVNLKFFADGKPVGWSRDSLDVYAFHIDVPQGTKNVVAKFQFVSATQSDQGRVVMTPALISVQPNSVSLYPAGYYTRQIPVEMQVKYPAGWEQAGALKAQKRGDTFFYEKTDYDTLVDSPMLAGRYWRKEQLSDKVSLDMFADQPKYLAATAEQLAAHKKLVAEAKAAFINEPYDRYHFLLSVSDELGGIGLEHHRSSENGVNPGYFTEWDKGPGRRNLLPHEYVHSWAGKYRRPVGLATPDFRTPMENNLLWAYEGLDQFYGYVLGSRSGLFTKQQTLDAIAGIAANLDSSRGRDWRTVEDTTHDPIITARRPKPWRSMQRSEDYYNEGLMMWLAADATIRRQSKGAKSIDDFARIWFAGTPGDYRVKPFVYQDVVTALNQTVAYDWDRFLRDHIYGLQPRLDLSGLTANGYKLAFTDKQSAAQRSNEGNNLDLAYSLGATLDSGGKVTAVMWDSPAFQSGLTMGTQILAVNGQAYSADALKDAIVEAKRTRKPVQFMVKDGRYFRTFDVAYYDGLRYPSLEKIGQGETGLDRLLAPRTR